MGEPSDDDLDRTRELGAAPAPPRQDNVPTDDSLSIDHYRILGKLGEGGMGVVYEAEQQNPRRRVAVKVVRGGQFIDASQVRMFQREAETLARQELAVSLLPEGDRRAQFEARLDEYKANRVEGNRAK